MEASPPTHLYVWVQITGRETKKLNDKQRRLAETAARNKAEALKDDDNVFDVSYERQGGGAEDTVSATDIKVTLCGCSQTAEQSWNSTDIIALRTAAENSPEPAFVSFEL